MALSRPPLPLGDGPERDAARMMGLRIDRFRELLPSLLSRNFPPADPTTGLFDLDAIQEWRRRRYPRVFTGSLAPTGPAHDAQSVVGERLRVRGWAS